MTASETMGDGLNTCSQEGAVALIGLNRSAKRNVPSDSALRALGQAVARAREIAARVARNAPFTNDAVRNALPRIADTSSNGSLFTEAMVASLVSMTDEVQQRLRDFLDKRAARVQAPPRSDG